MKFIYTFLVFIVFSFLLTVKGQIAGLWYDATQIKAIFSKEVLSGKLDNGIRYLAAESEDNSMHFFYLLSADDICRIVVIYPQTETALNWMVEYLNKNHTIVSNTEWRTYSKQGISEVKLSRREELINFTCTIIEEW